MRWEDQRTSTVWLTILATFLFLLFSISFWFYREVYNKEAFQQNVSTALQTETSRKAMASLIIDQAFKNRPIIRNFLSEQAEPALAGMLNAPRTQTIFNKFISQVYDSLFSEHPRAIVLNISNIKTFVERLVTLIEEVSGRDVQEFTIPDSIVIVREGVFPSLLAFGTVLLTIGPIALLISLALVIWLMLRSLNKAAFFRILGICLSLGSLISILLVSWYQVISLARLDNSDVRDIAEQIITQFSSAFIDQNLILLFAGIILLAGGLFYERFFPSSTTLRPPSKKI